MSDAYEIVQYRPEFKEQVLVLQQDLWRSDVALHRAYFEWKYEQNPYVPEPLVYLAMHRGVVVGMRGMCGTKWQVGCPPTTFVMPHAADLVIAPEHRNQGLFTRLMTAAFEDLAQRGYECVITLSAGEVTTFGSLAMGWKSVGPMALVAWHGAHALVSRRIRRAVGRMPFFRRYANARPFLARCERQPFVHFDRARARSLARTHRFVTLTRTPRPAAMAHLVERIPYDGRIRPFRDSEFFAWRFRDPANECRFLYWERGQLEGYLVLNRPRFHKPSDFGVHILDCEATAEETRADLLAAAVAKGKFADLRSWTISLPESTKRVLEALGFTPIDPSRRKRGFPVALLRPVRDADLGGTWTIAGRQLLDIGNWDLRMICSF